MEPVPDRSRDALRRVDRESFLAIDSSPHELKDESDDFNEELGKEL